MCNCVNKHSVHLKFWEQKHLICIFSEQLQSEGAGFESQSVLRQRRGTSGSDDRWTRHAQCVRIKLHYTKKASTVIKHILHAANNDGLEVLDLSWNHLRMKGAVAFCAGLKVLTQTHSSHTFSVKSCKQSSCLSLSSGQHDFETLRPLV